MSSTRIGKRVLMMEVKVSIKTADGLIKRTSSMLGEIESKTCPKTKNVIDRGKGSKTLSEVKPVKNIYKNLQSFLEISPV